MAVVVVAALYILHTLTHGRLTGMLPLKKFIKLFFQTILIEKKLE